MESITNKNALIVGATGGIGSETARLLHLSGAELWLMGRDIGKLSALASELTLSPDRILVCDIAQEQEVQAAAASVHAAVGKLDILVNAAGVGVVKPLENLTAADFEKTIAANLFGPFLLMKYFLPPMKAAGKGLIINITGVLGKTPMAGSAIYSASKYGLVGMMKSIREELKRTEIRMTDLYLGGTDTPFWDSDVEIRFQREKFVTAKEAARSIWFLCQQPSSGVVSEMVLQPFNHQAI